MGFKHNNNAKHNFQQGRQKILPSQFQQGCAIPLLAPNDMILHFEKY